MMYGNYAQQPELGYLTRREGLLGSASVKVAANWVVSGAARWDLEANKLNQYVVGAGYVDDCFVAGGQLCDFLRLRRRHHPPCAQSRLHAADRVADPRQYGQRGLGYPVEPAGTLPEDEFPARHWFQFESVDRANMIMTTTLSHRLSVLILTCAAALALTSWASPSHAQTVAVMVNGEPITNYDIEQRSKLTFLTTHKPASRQEVVGELIDER